MLFGQKKAQPAAARTASAYVKDATDASFMTDVIEASREVPVIVDFWAPWCGPCKTLGPQLEAAVEAAHGKVRMVKVDVDQNQQVAAQLRVQSIPTVYAFFGGQPVDGFQGAVSQAEVKAFVDRLVQLGGDGGLGEALAAAEEMLEQGAAADAAQTFAAILQQEPDNAAALGGLARAFLAAGELDRAEGLLNTAPDAIHGAQELEAARAQLRLLRQAQDAGPLSELQSRVEDDPTDHQARFDLAAALQGAGRTEEAVDHLLELFRRDREWNDGAARKQLLTIFDSLKPQDPVALKGRRRLGSMILA